MKKIALSLIVAVAFCNSNFTFAGGMGTMGQEPNWTGFYLGANTGYWWKQANNVATNGSPSFINPTFALGASSIVNALVQVATNNFSLHSYGFIGGGQVGYNYQYSKAILLGLDADLDGLTNSNNTFAAQKIVDVVGFNEQYIGFLAVKQKMNYLGTVRARLGYLFHSTYLVYGSGGFAYGNVTLDTFWSDNESLGQLVFPAIVTQNNLSKILTGWTAGAGIEWLFKPGWSTRLEYTYYGLNNLNAPVTLTQINSAEGTPILWGSANANTVLPVSVGTIRVGVNYHFS